MCHWYCVSPHPIYYRSHFNKGRDRRSGLTLLELVIVLAILAVLTGVAVRSLEGIADQTNYESSQRSLEECQDSLYVQVKTNIGISVSGFVADVGRLPLAGNVENPLIELFDASLFPPYTVSGFDDPYTNVVESIPIGAGWRGPYIHLPPGNTLPLDGWGHSWVALDASGIPAATGETIRNIVSPGSNGLLDGNDIGYARDLSLPHGMIHDSRVMGTLPVRVVSPNGDTPNLQPGESIRLHVYGPQGGNAAILASIELTMNGNQYAGNLSNIAIGPRVVTAIATTGTVPNLIVNRSSIFQPMMIVPGMNGELQLILPNP